MPDASITESPGLWHLSMLLKAPAYEPFRETSGIPDLPVSQTFVYLSNRAHRRSNGSLSSFDARKISLCAFPRAISFCRQAQERRRSLATAFESAAIKETDFFGSMYCIYTILHVQEAGRGCPDVGCPDVRMSDV